MYDPLNMKATYSLYLLATAVFASPILAENQTVNSRIGKLEFTHDFANGYPTRETVERLYDARDFQRACQADLGAIPAVSFAQWQRVEPRSHLLARSDVGRWIRRGALRSTEGGKPG